MGSLVLVRHGQASFGAADYDVLSPAGEQQARLLGAHWARLSVQFDRAFTGPRRRQRCTAEIAAGQAGRGFPAIEPLAGLDEIRVAGDFGAAPPVDLATFLFGGGEAQGVEPWADFSARVRGALRAMCEAAPRGHRVVAFTSGGTICAALQLACKLETAVAGELMLRVRNASITEFVFSKDRFSLQSFNGTPHLEDGALLTFR